MSLEEAEANIARYREEHRQEASEFARQQEQAARQRRMENALGRAGIPDRFMGKAFENFETDTKEQQRVLRICKAYADNFGNVRDRGCCLMLLGSVGTGKTHLAMAILRSVVEGGHTGLYMRVADALRYMRSVFSRDDMTEQDALRTLTDCDLLVLDEVGVAIGDPEKRQAMLYDVMDTRYMEGKPTILISNMDASEMERYIGVRLYDRLMEDGGVALEFNWSSKRRAQT